MSDGGPGLRRRAARGAGRRAAGGHGPRTARAPAPATVLVAGDTAYVETAQACGLHLTRASGTPRTPPRTASASCSPPRSTPGRHGRRRARRSRHQRRRRRAARRARRHRRRRPGRRRRRPATASTSVDLAPARARLGAVAARRGHRRGQPAARAVRRDQDLRPAEGDRRGAVPVVDALLEHTPRRCDRRQRRSSRAPARPAGSGFALLALVATAVRRRLVADAVGLARARADLVLTGEGSFDSPAARGKVPPASPRRPTARSALRRPGGGGDDRLPGDAGAGRRVGVLAGRPPRGGAGASPSRPAALADARPSGRRAPGPVTGARPGRPAKPGVTTVGTVTDPVVRRDRDARCRSPGDDGHT